MPQVTPRPAPPPTTRSPGCRVPRPRSRPTRSRYRATCSGRSSRPLDGRVDRSPRCFSPGQEQDLESSAPPPAAVSAPGRGRRRGRATRRALAPPCRRQTGGSPGHRAGRQPPASVSIVTPTVISTGGRVAFLGLARGDEVGSSLARTARSGGRTRRRSRRRRGGAVSRSIRSPLAAIRSGIRPGSRGRAAAAAGSGRRRRRRASGRGASPARPGERADDGERLLEAARPVVERVAEGRVRPARASRCRVPG